MSTAELRERRRARILMGSDERMKKVIGALQKESDKTTISTACAEPIQLNHPACVNEQRDGVVKCAELSTCQATNVLKKLISNPREISDDIVYNNNPEENDVPVMDNVSPTMAAEGEVDDADNQESQKADGSAASLNMFRTFIWLLAGVVVRLAITSCFATYIQTLVYPFIAVEISVYGIQQMLGIDVIGGSSVLKSGLWISLLHLLGIDRSLIESYGRIMGLVYSTLDDFAMYLFAFVMTHVIL